MAGLITLAELEVAIGEDIDEADEPRIQWYIDAVSNFIKIYLDDPFEEVVDEVLICQADGRGIIEFQHLNDVTLVEERNSWTGDYTSLLVGDYRFDGISKVFYLVPYETYRLTVSYGSDVVPPGLKDVVVQLVAAGSGLDAAAVGGLKSYRIGDKEEVYGVSMTDTGTPLVTMASLQRETLDSFRQTTRTWRL